MAKKVILLKDNHTHDGALCKAGDVIELDEQQAEFLITTKAAELADKTKNSKKE